MELYKKLKELREKNNISQLEISDQLKISRQGYNHYENGKRLPSLETLIDISKLYDVSIDYLLGNPIQEKLSIEEKISLIVKEFDLDIISEKVLVRFLNLPTEDRINLIKTLNNILGVNTAEIQKDISKVIEEHSNENNLKKETI